MSEITCSGDICFDEIGYWSELKLEIVKSYAQAYSTILSAQTKPRFHHVYIDGFSGPGRHLSRTTGDFVAGSPTNALLIEPPFKEYFLIDMDEDKVGYLRQSVGDRADVHVIQGDCNAVLRDQVLPKVQWKDYRRGLCLLDPYGLDLDWDVIAEIGQMKTVDLFLNFPVMDMNRNALWRDQERVPKYGKARMTAFWGDESWKQAAFGASPQLGLFGEETDEKKDNRDVAEAYRQRLKQVAGFAHVPEPIPMRNSSRAVVYYLFFATPKGVANNIVQDIFDSYRRRGL